MIYAIWGRDDAGRWEFYAFVPTRAGAAEVTSALNELGVYPGSNRGRLKFTSSAEQQTWKRGVWPQPWHRVGVRRELYDNGYPVTYAMAYTREAASAIYDALTRKRYDRGRVAFFDPRGAKVDEKRRFT